MSRVLIICNTVLQIIFATNLKFTLFSGDEVDLIISNHTKNAERIVENSRVNHVTAFSNVYYVKTLDFDKSPAAIVSEGTMGIIKDELHKDDILKTFIDLNLSYDTILTANPDKFAELVFECQYKRNKNVSFYMYEDGLSAYCVLGEQLKKKRHAQNSFFHVIFDFLLGKQYAHRHIRGIYLFDPALCTWDDDIPFLKMEKVNKNNKDLLHTLNLMFGYSNMTDHYDTKYIFFEESYYVEGVEVNDVALVEYIAQIVGKENIFVKTHPRNPVNRFKELGYKTNEDTFIPWELIAMNENIEDKVLLSIASGSIANPYMIMGIKTKSIVLMKCATGDFGKEGNIYNDFLYENIYLKAKEVFSIPDTIQCLEAIL